MTNTNEQATIAPADVYDELENDTKDAEPIPALVKAAKLRALLVYDDLA